ncbi:MAG: hypothetical protein M1819_002244 [Sarea resinae]|nr:MAG: hypothetical protein M1819_002244 [Sarea resinae]
MTAFVGLSDLLAVSMPEEIAGYYFGAQAPVRLFFFFIVAGYPYVFKRDGIASQLAGEGKPYDSSGPGEHLKNSIVFSLGFIEFVTWFWVFITLREERKDAADRQVEKLKAEESMM